MSDKDKLLRETEAMLRAVLISSPRGVRFEKLLRDYRELTFSIIPYEKLGFPRLENFLQSIPSVARVERGPDNEWVVKGVASSADQHVAKLISKQKKPTLRKSAKSMISKRRVTPLPPRMNTPVKKPPPRPSASKTSSKFVLPPRLQRLQEMQNKTKAAPPRQGNLKPGKGRDVVEVGWGRLLWVCGRMGCLWGKGVVPALGGKFSPAGRCGTGVCTTNLHVPYLCQMHVK